MYRRIIAGYDGREQAEDALALASDLAGATGAELIVAGVVDSGPKVADSALGMPPTPLPANLDSLRKDALERLAGPAQAVHGKAEAVVSASPSRGLAELAERAAAEVIVVGSSHRGSAGRVLAGSVGERLLQGAPCAVAVAPAGYAQRERSGLRVVGVGFEGDPEAEVALRVAASIAEAAGAKLRVVAAIPPQTALPGKGLGFGPRHELEAAAREYLDERVDRGVKSVGERVTAEGNVVVGKPAEVLGSLDVGLLVVGSRGYGPLRTVLLGGVSLPLIRSALCPVLVIPRGAGIHDANGSGGVHEGVSEGSS